MNLVQPEPIKKNFLKRWTESQYEKFLSTPHKILNMPLGTNWIFRRGEKPVFSRTVDLSEYDIPCGMIEKSA